MDRESCQQLNLYNYSFPVNAYPLGKVPTLQVDGTVICQSQAILHYIARELNLYGESVMQHAECDQVIETLREIFNRWEPLMVNQALTKEEKVKRLDFT